MPQSRKSQLSFAILLGATLLLLATWYNRTPAPQTVLLWENGAPGAHGDAPEDKPSLRIFLPSAYNASKAAVIICPGGAYKLIMSTYEGEDIARWFNSIGVAAFVLKYRIYPNYFHPSSMYDVLRAIRYVRYNAGNFHLDTDKIGVIGFSAGGHLASIAATHYTEFTPLADDPVDTVSARPDFAILGYPIISLLPPLTHDESATNLLGEDHGEEARRALSNQFHVTKETPPVFMFHTADDRPVSAENRVQFYEALRAAKVPAELHIYERGRHGAGLANGKNGAPDLPLLTTWPTLAENWMKNRGLIGNKR
jgi:acetyl esterase/lipase